MTDDELIILLNDLESDRVERKASFSDPGKIRQAICAFANDMPNHGKPGVIFVGEKDHGGNASLVVSDELLRNIASLRDDGTILPFPNMLVQKCRPKDYDLVVIIVQPSDSPPIRYDGRTWIRVGPRRATATAEEERRLNEKQRSQNLPHDLNLLGLSSADDLDHDLFQKTYLPSAIAAEILRENHRTITQQMASLRFVSPCPPFKPTVVGVLAIGKSPADYIPGAYIQFLRIDGLEMTDPIADQRKIHGPMPDLLRQLNDVMKANIHIATDIRSASTEIRIPDYPLVALQQLAHNAVMHRDYHTSNAPVRLYWFQDRVEIQNPGGPFGQVTVENFGSPNITDYRNPNVAEVMKNLGYVQRFGVGIQLAHKHLQNNGNPPPEFSIQPNHVHVTVRKCP